ncbi:dihydroorotase [Sporobacter termitidis DSM 10068]|uniref:Dihydroorotase n=1 Tax=Sporobacter termitidis DSM 10068 TaxID=1123282 RepID=A0A1M5WET7_9FIRM|nr:dihydroorotase [Sporobacter termitidis]SHH86002.1 dihydroorotase [Sporobacter termitidis DSM 10068]
MLLIKNARIVDPGTKTDAAGTLFVKDGKIAPPDAAPADLRGVAVLDAGGFIVSPGLVDMHVHFRDPGFLYKEDLFTGAEAAAAGGVTTVACMPNTSPVLDSPEVVSDIVRRAKAVAVNILTYGAVTVGQKGAALTDAAALAAAGACALSDDGQPVMSAAILRQAMKAAAPLGLFISSHCEDADLVKNYSVNEGAVSEKLGLPGRPAVAEELMAARDALLARDTGARIHIAHVSTAGTVDIVRRAKAGGVRITAETCPQYFTLTEDDILNRGSISKINPPLRTRRDVDAIIAGLADGTLDAIATDHAPHASHEKALPLTEAPSGMVGLETSLAAALTALYHTGRLSLMRIIALMSSTPAKILGTGKGTLAAGADADIVVFDPDARWTVDPERFRSKGRNTPFAGMALRGRVKYTIVGGKIVYKGE